MPIVQPIEPYASDDALLLALCIWREARGEPLRAKCGVAHTVFNRCKLAPREGFKRDVRANILKPWAFSSFMDGDVNSVKYPAENDPSWRESLQAARALTADPTLGAVFYYSLPLTAPPKAWGAVEHTVDIGGLHFYRLPDTIPIPVHPDAPLTLSAAA